MIVILPWNLAREISEQLAYTAEWGARLVVPIPVARYFGGSDRGLTLPPTSALLRGDEEERGDEEGGTGGDAMKVVIFCGGLGVRMGEETQRIPKPMIRIGNSPILWHIMRYYAAWGHTEFVLCLGHKGDVIKEYFLSHNEALMHDFVLEGTARSRRSRSSTATAAHGGSRSRTPAHTRRSASASSSSSPTSAGTRCSWRPTGTDSRTSTCRT